MPVAASPEYLAARSEREALRGVVERYVTGLGLRGTAKDVVRER